MKQREVFVLGCMAGVAAFFVLTTFFSSNEVKYQTCLAGAVIALNEASDTGVLEPSVVQAQRIVDSIKAQCRAEADK